MEHCLTPGNYPTRAGEPRPYPWQSVPAENPTPGGGERNSEEVGAGFPGLVYSSLPHLIWLHLWGSWHGVSRD